MVISSDFGNIADVVLIIHIKSSHEIIQISFYCFSCSCEIERERLQIMAQMGVER